MATMYVGRDTAGGISALQDEPGGGASEAIAEDDPEVLQFLHRRWRQSELERLDLEFVRVIEDLIEILIARDVIRFTDLPPKVLEKLTRRRQIRQQIEYGAQLGSEDVIRI